MSITRYLPTNPVPPDAGNVSCECYCNLVDFDGKAVASFCIAGSVEFVYDPEASSWVEQADGYAGCMLHSGERIQKARKPRHSNE